jgi:hypothetical protein
MDEARPAQGEAVVVKVKGVPVKATYLGWSDQYNLAVVDVGGTKLYRKLFNDLVPTAAPETVFTPQSTVPDGRAEFHSGTYHIFDTAGKLKATFAAPALPRPIPVPDDGGDD